MFFVVITRGGAEMIKNLKSYFFATRSKGTIAGWECQWWKGFLDFSCCRGMDGLDKLDWMDKTEFCQPHILKSNLNSLNYSEDCRVLILNGELNGLYWLAAAFCFYCPVGKESKTFLGLTHSFLTEGWGFFRAIGSNYGTRRNAPETLREY